MNEIKGTFIIMNILYVINLAKSKNKIKNKIKHSVDNVQNIFQCSFTVLDRAQIAELCGQESMLEPSADISTKLTTINSNIFKMLHLVVSSCKNWQLAN